MREITLSQAVNEALAEEMRRDPSVFILGEDVAEAGTPFKVLSGLVQEFGKDRVIDTPISEPGFMGLAVGAAMTGARPVVGIMFGDFLFLIMSQLGVESSYWHFVLGLAFFGFGMGLAGTPATTAITSSLPMSKQGVASAWNDTSRELGSAFGIAILGSLLNQGYRDGMADAVASLPPELAERVLGSIAFTASPLVALMGDLGDQLVLQGREAFVGGVGNAVLVGALILLVTAVAVAALAPGRQVDAGADG